MGISVSLISPRSFYKRAFSLIEAAIVLGVVGLVIGGIWVGAAAISERHQITRQSTAILQIVAGARQLFPAENYPSVDHTFTWTTPAMVSAGLISSEFPLLDGCCYVPTVFGNGSKLGAGLWRDDSNLGVGGRGIDVTVTNLTLSQCIKLSSAIGGAATNDGMAYLAIGSASYIRSFPASFSTISSNCTAQLSGGYVDVVFMFRG